MFGVTTSDDYKPVTWVGRYPIDVTTLLVGLHVACAVIIALLFFGNTTGVLDYLQFDSAAVLGRFQAWRLATYALIHSPAGLLWFAIEMYMLFTFGREVERFIGRRAFIVLYTLLLLVPTVLLTVLGLWTRLGMAGSGTLHFGVFLAFAAIYPNVEMMMLRIQTKWIALILVAIGTLVAMAGHDWATLITLWATAAVAFLYVQNRGIGSELEWWSALKEKLSPKPKFQVVPRVSPRRTVEPENVHESIDPILDKIAKSGINSLTTNERRALDRARNQLLKKGK
ncbi:MAG: rhomboid family intramembrane serine protease [Verrucomicrobiota bacterium]|nr:rhomboid family intramembrane serine protease [Verrucomicrobiota bacterium]